MPSIAVVILNYNGEKLLQQFLPAVVKYSKKAEVVVADNNSSDGSQDLVRKYFPSVKLIQIPSNLGFSGGYNYALHRITATYFILLNSDVEVTPNWIEPIIKVLEKDKTIGAAQPKILSYRERDRFEYAGAAGGFIDNFGYPFCRGRVFDHIEKDAKQYEGIEQVFWASGACLFIRASLFKLLNGFDEDFFAHMEEIDLCWRLNRLNYHVVCCSASVVYHVGGGTLSRLSPIKVYYNFRNGLAMLIKNMGMSTLLKNLPVRMLFDGLAVVKFLLEGRPSNALAVLKAYAYIIKKSRRLYSKRLSQKVRLPFCKTNLIYKGSVVFDYFILGRKSYRALKFYKARRC